MMGKKTLRSKHGGSFSSVFFQDLTKLETTYLEISHYEGISLPFGVQF